MTTGKPAAKSASKAALVSPVLDFWLVGGLSILLLAALYALQLAGVYPSQFQMGWWAYYAAFAINYPHFAYSYQLFYDGFWTQLRDKAVPLSSRLRLLVAGILVPLILLGYLWYCLIAPSVMTLAYGTAAMFFFVGWHYVKQGYGALITLSVYKKIYYTVWEKRVLYLNAYAVWIYTWCKLNGPAIVMKTFFDVEYMTAGVPHWMVTASLAFLVVTTLLTVRVLLRAWLFDLRGISVNGLTGYLCGSYLWVLFPYVNPIFFVFVPLFHSLQYLPFVWKFKSSEIRKQNAGGGEGADGDKSEGDRPKPLRKWKWLIDFGLFIAVGVVLGAVFMDWLPKQFDQNFTGARSSASFFLVAFLLFINIHHYFIDNAFWRRDNKKVQEYLFRA